jgi:tetratricopeptide (TPR) repeat protein
MYVGKTSRKSGDLKGAVEAYRIAVRLRPDFLEAWVELGRNLAQAGRHDDAVRAFDRADALNPQHAPTAINRGLSAQKRGQANDARRWFSEAIKRDPVNMMSHLNLCMLEFSERDVPAAERCADGSLKLHPGFADGYWIRGRARFMLGRLASAQTDLKRFIELEPNREEGYLDLSRVQRALGDGKKARKTLERGLQKLGPNDRLRHALGTLGR